MPYVWILLALAAAAGILTFVYRYHLYRVAYDVEYDLRVAMYEHLTRMSFSFYDRVQSGQLISRANSDIRSMQLFLTFAPLLALNILSFLVAFGLMLSVDVTLTLVALAPLPFVYLVGVRMRDLMFPISWVIQARTADIATIVEENVTGVRVVKSFAAEQRRSARSRRPPAACGGPPSGRSTSGRTTRRSWRTCPGSAWPRCCSTAASSPSTATSPSARSSRSTPTSSCCRRRSGCSASS